LVIVRVFDIDEWTCSTEDAFQQARRSFADKERLGTVETEISEPVVLGKATRGVHRDTDDHSAGDGNRPESNGRPLKPTVLLPRWPLERLRGAFVERTNGDRPHRESRRQDAVAPGEERLRTVDRIDLGGE
jgi:hypothetical protein